MRRAKVDRKTLETEIQLALSLDGAGKAVIRTGIGFFDHMLHHVARHGLLDLTINAKGDLAVDPHHTVEDIGICLGKAFSQALGDHAGLTRYGHAVIPMDEALAEAAVDISGRPFLAFQAQLPKVRLGEFDAELAEEFFRAFAMNSRCTVHLMLRSGTNVHHCLEALFKAFGRALRSALTIDPREKDVPSTKGSLET